MCLKIELRNSAIKVPKKKKILLLKTLIMTDFKNINYQENISIT